MGTCSPMSDNHAKTWWLLSLGVTLLTALLTPALVAADTGENVRISIFGQEDCSHCQDLQAWLTELQRKRHDLEITVLDVSDPANARLFATVTAQYDLPRATPLTLIGTTLISGFDRGETTGRLLQELIDAAETNTTFADIQAGGAQIAGTSAAGCAASEPCSASQLLVTIPLINRVVDVGRLSLAGLSLVLGLVDGFNPCALWVLVMFLLILSQAGSRRRLVQFAGLFILAETIMYYAILNVWFTVWDFVALDRIITPLVSLLAIGSGLYFLYKFATWKAVCDIASPDQTNKLQTRAHVLATRPLTLAATLGIIGLAFSVNVFEFACSIGIPQTFTKILEINQLSFWTRQWFMGLYVVMYMIDDLIVFAIALYGIDKISSTKSYSRWSTLVGGLLMLLLGLIMLLRPAWLIL